MQNTLFNYACLLEESSKDKGLNEHLAIERQRVDARKREARKREHRAILDSVPKVKKHMGRRMIHATNCPTSQPSKQSSSSSSSQQKHTSRETNASGDSDSSSSSSSSSSRSGSNETFTVLSYNMLCQMYARERNFPGVSPEFLSWKRRSELLLREWMSYDAELIALQEMDRYDDFWRKQMQKKMYESAYKRRTRSKSDGCAIFWRQSSFTIVGEPFGVEFNDLAVFKDLKRVDEQRVTDNVALLVTLKHLKSGRLLIVVNVHLYWDPSFPEIKLEQCHYLLCKLHEYRHSVQLEHGLCGEQLPFVICGDFNSMPDSEVYRLLSTREATIERTRTSMKGSLRHISAYRELLKSVNTNDGGNNDYENNGVNGDGDSCGGAPYYYHCPFTKSVASMETKECPYRERVTFRHDFALQSTYAQVNGREPPFTNYTQNFVGCLDYVWISAEQLRTRSVLEMITEQQASEYGSLPSKVYPSDHLSLFISVQFC